ncbi:MAG: patatin-like phospholipase family protein [Actinobacteria bacterium]|nr:patatin-like phospholipase family protein [Actinomycetota bacterium]MCI0543912.1 patatin-like phospholipase family protein [Actinomycetota bacterium]
MSEAVRTAFVLGGGGRWGAVEVGMLKALGEVGIVPDIVLGTSIGALNGSVIADDPGPSGVSRLAGFWEEVSGADLFRGGFVDRVRNVATLKPAIHETSEIRVIVERVHRPDKLIEDLVIPFQCVAACIERAAEHWFTTGPLVDAMLASSAVPALFPPVEIAGEHFYDGGLVNSVPLTRAVELGAEVVYVLQVGRMESPLRPPHRLHEAALISFEIARRHRFATTMANLPAGVEVHLLPSGNPVAFDDRRQLRWRDTSDTSTLIETAYVASSEYLGGVARV